MRIRTQRLPTGYRELEYIESDGFQYIDTNYLPNFNTRIICDMMLTTTTNSIMLFGAIGSTPNILEYSCYVNSSKLRPYFQRNSSSAYQFYSEILSAYELIHMDWNVTTSTQHFDINQGKNKYSYDKTFDLTTSYEFDHNMFIFASSRNNGTPGWKGASRLYKMIIYNNGTLVRNFIPCERYSDSKPGIYDVVNDVFYVNQGTGEFIRGPYKDGYKLGLKLLPDEYQQVEYIESTSSQYQYISIPDILCDYWELECQYSNTNSEQCILGNSVAGDNRWELYTSSGSPYYNLWTPGGSIIGNNSALVKSKLTLDYTTGSFKVNDVQIGTRVLSSQPKFLFSYGTSAYFTNGKVYSLVIKYQNNETLHLIPCYRKSDNVVGMYDLVNRVFYTNQGSGTFVKGNNVSNTFSCKVAGGSSDIYYGYNQLIEVISRVDVQGVTFTPEGDNVYSISGTSQNSYASWHLGSLLTDDHTYLVGIQIIENPNNLSLGTGLFNVTDGSTSVITSGSTSRIVTYPVGANKYFGIIGFTPNTVLDGTKIRLWLIDLSEWYYGRTIPTLSEYQEKFRKDYYGFCPTPIKLTRYQIEALPIYRYNQLVENGNFETSSLSGFFFGWNLKSYKLEDKILKFEQQSQYTLSGVGVNAQPVIGHKYFIGCDVISYNSSDVSFVTGFGYQYAPFITVSAGKSTRYEVLLTKGSDTSTQYNYVTWGNNNAKSELYSWGIRNVMIIDLTDWYGSGSEPETVEEFKQTFPNLYYPYSKKRLLNKYMINKLIN